MGACALITPVYLEIALMSGARSGARATGQAISAIDTADISIHALREEGDLTACLISSNSVSFLPTPSVRRATAGDGRKVCRKIHFYPRPPRGGRPVYVPDSFVFHLFLSTPSVKRATLELLRGLLRFKLFLSTPP